MWEAGPSHICVWAGPGSTESGRLLLASSFWVRFTLAGVNRVQRPVKTVSGDTRNAVEGMVLGRGLMWSSSFLDV